MADNIAVLAGYTKEVHLSAALCDLYLLVKPETDLDSQFKAWDTDEQEFISVSGWLFTVVEDKDGN